MKKLVPIEKDYILGYLLLKNKCTKQKKFIQKKRTTYYNKLMYKVYI